MRNVCDRCDAPLIEIDHYGDRLKGCIECNIWRGGKNAFVVELSVEDIEALRVVRQARQGELQLQSTLTCPHCGHQTIETMPTDACVATAKAAARHLGRFQEAAAFSVPMVRYPARPFRKV